MKDFTWYENCQKRQKVFQLSFCIMLGTERGIVMLSMRRHGFPYSCSGEPCCSFYGVFIRAMLASDIVPILSPFCRIVFDILPDLAVIVLVADDVFKISPLPKRSVQTGFAALVCRRRFQSTNNTAQRRGGPCGRPWMGDLTDEMNMIRHYYVRLDLNSIQVFCLFQTLLHGFAVFGKNQGRATARDARF